MINLNYVRLKKPWVPVALVALIALPSPSLAQGQPGQAHSHSAGHMEHTAIKPARSTAPVEGGQAAFAAIQEIVAILMADSATDWSRVNIETLRQHLIDMDNVVLRSHVRPVRRITGGS